VPNFLKTMAQVPGAVVSFAAFLGAFRDSGRLDQRTKELAILMTSLLNACHYCTGHHAAGGLAAGLDREDPRELLNYSKGARFWEKGKAVLPYAETVTLAPWQAGQRLFQGCGSTSTRPRSSS